jgi:toxin FitB
MAPVRGCFLDTSVLVGGVVELRSTSAPAQRVMAAVAEGDVVEPITAWHCCLEFYSVLTRLPAEYRVSPTIAVKLVEEEILARFRVAQLPSEARLGFLRVAEQERVAGGRVYDAHIAEVARKADAEIVVTENRRHFTSLLRHGLRVLTAAELLAEMD